MLHACIRNRVPKSKAPKGNNTTAMRGSKALKEKQDLLREMELHNIDRRGNTLDVSTVVEEINATAKLMEQLLHATQLAKTQWRLKHPKISKTNP